MVHMGEALEQDVSIELDKAASTLRFIERAYRDQEDGWRARFVDSIKLECQEMVRQVCDM